MSHPESLFSLELLVHHIRLQTHCRVPARLAVAVRFMDFPALLIHQKRSPESSGPEQAEQNQREFTFNRGKSCFFKLNPDCLCGSPLVAMVLDADEDRCPRLLGSSLISLAEATDTVKQLAAPSAHTADGIVSVRGLSGMNMGTMSLGYKLVCLGASLVPRVAEGSAYKHGSTQGCPDQERSKENIKSGSVCSPTGNNLDITVLREDAGDSKILLEDREDDDLAESPADNSFEEDLTEYRPPYLYYSNRGEEKSGNTQQDYRLLNLAADAFTFEDSNYEDEEDEHRGEGSSSKATFQKTTKASNREETSSVTRNVLGEALQQLPLLNALIAELSQLTLPPSPARVTRPVSDHCGASPRPRSQRDATHVPHSCLKDLPPPRNCSTPIDEPVDVKDGQREAIGSRRAQQKKLAYATTRTFNLRLKQVSPRKANHRECMLMRSGTQSRTSKGKGKPISKFKRPKKGGTLLSQSSNLDENIQTVMQSVTALRERVTLKPKTQQVTGHGRAPGASEDFCRVEELQRIPTPVPPSKDEHGSESDRTDSLPDGDKCNVSTPDLRDRRSSGSNSPGSLWSECSDPDYADDFDSLESSNASFSEPSEVDTPKSPTSLDSWISDSRSQGFENRPVPHPVPVEALESQTPKRVLMGTHVLRRRTHPPALSFSVDGDEKPSPCSGKPAHASDETGQVSGADSVLLSSSEKKNPPRNRDRVKGSSARSTSSFEAEEVEDELGSPDFRQEYQHVSELVAGKLPGYTM